VVGESGGPVVWRRGVPARLRQVPGAEFGSALDTNDRGDIAGASPTDEDFVSHAVLWH
jgi:hypothetical protein